MSKRGQNEGSISKRADGRWEAKLNLGYVNGRRKRKCFYGETRKHVAAALAKALREQQQGIPPASERETVEQFVQRWLADIRPSIAPATYTIYERVLRLYVVPALGKVRLVKLTPEKVQQLLNDLVARGLSPRTIINARSVLRKALNDALRWGLVGRNAAALARPPKLARDKRRYLTPADVQALLAAIARTRHEALFLATIGLGLRQGEALGLRWQDIDFDAGVAKVRMQLQRIDHVLQLKELKSVSSRRDIPLAPIVADALRAHRILQREARLAAGAYWAEQDFVFTSSLGTPLDARNVMRELETIRERAGMPWLTFHGLRHGFGSLLALRGVHPRVAMELMGHSDLRLTMEIYTHVAPELATAAAAEIDAALRAS